MHFKKQFAFKAKPQEAFYCSLTSVNSVIFYKNKGDRSDNSHQGISLQNILCAEHSVEIDQRRITLRPQNSSIHHRYIIIAATFAREM